MRGWITAKPTNGIHLNIGSGDPTEAHKQYPDIQFLCQDVIEFEGLDLHCDIRDLKQYVGDGECEYIMAVHVLEHFAGVEIDGVFKMLHDLLKVGGRLDVIVPNFRYHAQLLRENKDYDAVRYCFGDQRDEYDFHKTAFTPMILKDRLEKAGFLVLNLEEDTSLLANCVKP